MRYRPIDFRSDTVTRPTAAMRHAMAQAEVGDDVYGEDPTVQRLEAQTAALLGLEAGLFVSSGTMGNQLAIGVHCRSGDEVIVEANAHCIQYEGGAVSALWGVQPRMLEGQRGQLTPDQVSAAVRAVNDHFPRTRLLELENTHGRSAGAIWPVDAFAAVVSRAREHKLAVHLDGARLFNAQVASGVKAAEWAKLTDSTTVCFSKGLGAPVGSVLCGSRAFVAEARRLRKRLGGGMRQVGILAAGALFALEHHVERLSEDHANAQRLLQGLTERGLLGPRTQPVETNMLFADFGRPAGEVVSKLSHVGVRVNAEGAHHVRFVCHLDVSSADVDDAMDRIANALGAKAG